MERRWQRRVERRSGGMAHNILFVMHERRLATTRGEAALGPRKALIDAPVSLTLAFDQTKYGDEVIAQAYTREPHVVRERRDDSWRRVQVYLGPADLETAEMLEEVAAEIRERVAAGST